MQCVQTAAWVLCPVQAGPWERPVCGPAVGQGEGQQHGPASHLTQPPFIDLIKSFVPSDTRASREQSVAPNSPIHYASPNYSFNQSTRVTPNMNHPGGSRLRPVASFLSLRRTSQGRSRSLQPWSRVPIILCTSPSPCPRHFLFYFPLMNISVIPVVLAILWHWRNLSHTMYLTIVKKKTPRACGLFCERTLLKVN